MILVLLGTQDNSFHRLLEEIEHLIDKKIIEEKVIVQAGNTKYHSDKMEILDLISYEELQQLEKEAKYIITHGGVGSIVECIKLGKKVIAVPRYHRYGEHVNDHQLQIVQNFDGQGFIKGIQSVKDLAKAVEGIQDFKPKKFVSKHDKILQIVKEFIDNN